MSSEAWIDFAAGWISGGVSVLACQPVDTILTRMQANASVAINRSPDLTNAVPKVPKISAPGAATVILRPWSMIEEMVSDFGVKSLWRGSTAMIGAVPVQNALLMTGYGAGKRWSESSDSSDNNNNNGVLLGVFFGGCTGELRCCVRCDIFSMLQSVLTVATTPNSFRWCVAILRHVSGKIL